MAAIQRICLVVLMFFGAVGAKAQPVPTADEIFAAHSKAIGFAGAQASYGTIVAHAHVTVGDREYDTEVKSSVLPDGPGNAEFTIIRDGVSTLYADIGGLLTRTVGGGGAEPLPLGMRAFIHGHQFHRRVMFPALTLASISNPVTRAVFAGVPAYKVVGKTRDGDELSYYFDAAGKTMLGFQLIVTEDTGPNLLEFVLGDWSIKGGETLFWRLEITDKTDLYIYEFNKLLLLP